MRTYDVRDLKGFCSQEIGRRTSRLSSVQTDGSRVALGLPQRQRGLFLGLFRGLYCPFCRRAIAQMAASAEKLKPLGIESLGVVATDLENARLYYRFRPMQLPLAVDPTLATHRSYRVPKPDLTPQLLEAIGSDPHQSER